MSLSSSLAALVETFRDDALLAGLGERRGQLMALHYGGRWAARFAINARERTLRFRHLDRPVEIRLSAPYLGAFKGIFFEPDPRNLPILASNLEANAVPAKIIPMAAGPRPGRLKLRFGDDPTCSALESSQMHQLTETTEVEVTTVPVLLAGAGWDFVDLVKIDIEGSEEELLSIDNGWLSKVGALLLEIHPNTTPERIGSFLNPHGFTLRRHGRGREPVYFATREGTPPSE
jgi:FkbM family methyltransferase